MLKPYAVVVIAYALVRAERPDLTLEPTVLSLIYATGFTLEWVPLWFLPHLWLLSVAAAHLRWVSPRGRWPGGWPAWRRWSQPVQPKVLDWLLRWPLPGALSMGLSFLGAVGTPMVLRAWVRRQPLLARLLLPVPAVRASIPWKTRMQP